LGDLLRVIKDDGSTDPELDPKLSPSDAVRLYRLMLMERILDTRMLALQRQGRIGFYGPSVGQEATIVAPALALEGGDWVFPQYREPGAALALQLGKAAFDASHTGHPSSQLDPRVLALK